MSHPAPADVPAAIRETKAALRERIGDVAVAFKAAEELMRAEVAEVVRQRERGEDVWPVVRYADIAAGTVPAEQVEAVRRRGCAVVKGTFGRERAEGWDRELVDYLERNDFAGQYRYLDDGIFGGLAAGKPSIFPIYWSKPQMEAREDEAMVNVRGFLNSFWKHESEGRVWFDPTRDTAYPDRVRRREPGSNSAGLSAHTDSGSIERWLLPAYQQVFRHVFAGDPAAYDPWDGAFRTEVHEYDSTVMCSAFRTFQGWTALSDMQPTEGVLHVVPIPNAMAYLLLRALQDDVADDDLCGAANGQALPISARWHPVLMPALTPIPAVEPGDTVWWHGDMIHSVGPVQDQQGWGNVMYIPASPWCDKNAAYARECGEAFITGVSPSDFAAEDYEAGWTGRPRPADLSLTGLQQLGLA
ncbi:DUF1479 domain-containing protein [Spirilliplanes yamanashiensis]|uniref:DUF1479 domain-containing protein n=1 Tax=Spirilliplanes yamanashiensis TaxID=42233 RepID=A0A8J4DJP2_9ACTN|nr:DUF1479 domain-containing protein [Spirilliplanes yamanashiensis]MDP9817597.1 hypothetical protein [Spirilliplanes yamanashiensis]GIJ04407.1 hypothetical protein Sya03_37590 [Spirilliplanes yamanashiensis]